MSAARLVRLALSTALALAVGPDAYASPGPDVDTPPAPAEETAPSTEQATAEAPRRAVETDTLADVVLPCGVRVIAARDDSLPVAAVVLAVDVGTEDDPVDHPGLVHALAFHLQAGNRELQPGEGLASAHDVGGLATMAIGHAQVRFESLVPVSQLDRMLWIEAVRLRAPTVNETLWLKSLNYARADRRPKYPVPPNVMARVWDRPGLGHDGHVVPRELGKMLPEAVAAQLSKNFGYRRATLVVVSPRAPARVVERVRELFADLPAVPRDARGAAPTTEREADGPLPVPTPGQKGDTLVWAVPPSAGARAWAEIVCATLNRQRRGDADGPKSRLRCTYVDDARRPVLAVRTAGADDPAALARARLARIESGSESALVSAQRDRMRRRLRGELHVPMELARRLAQVEAATPTGGGDVDVDAMTGLADITNMEAMRTHVGHVFDPSHAVLLVPGEQAPEAAPAPAPEEQP